MPTAAALVAVVAGSLVAIQSRLNGELGARLHDPYLAAVVSFGSGLVLLVVLLAARPAARAALRRPPGPTRWWFWVGGAGGALLVAVNARAAPVLGVALLTVGGVAGQTAGSLAVDQVGLGPAGRQPVTARRLLGAALALGAVVVAAGGGSGRLDLPLLAATVGAGVVVAVQLAVNGRLRGALGDAVATTTVNFAVGSLALGLGAAALAVAGDLPARHWPGNPLLYAGGALGVVFVTLATWLVRALGVLRLSLLAIAGQLAGAALLDRVVPPPGGGLSPATLVAAVITLAAVRLAGNPRQRRATRSPGP